MIKYVSILITALVTWGFTNTVTPPTAFEGKIHFITEYTYFPPQLERYKDILPTYMDIYIRENLVKREGPTGMANGFQIYIKNLSTQSGYTAMKVGDVAVAYRNLPADYQVDLNNMPTPTSIEYTSETKKFGGFVGKKALVYLPNFTQPFTVYYTQEIPANAFVVYKGLKGFPLYFEGDLNGVKYTSYAQMVSPSKQNDAQFLLPKEYKLVSLNEFKTALTKTLE